MVNNPYVSFATEDPYQKAAREAEQRAQLAELMKQQAFQPFEARPAPIGRTEGIAKLLAAALAGMTDRERRESAQKAREMDIEQATTELQRIAQPTDESVDIQELLGLQPSDVERIKGVPGKFEMTATAPEFDISDTGEVSGFKPMEITSGETPDLGFQLPEMTPQQKRSAYIRMLGGGPVSQAFGQMGIEQTFKKPETAEFSPTVNYDAAGNAFVVNKAGEMQYLRGVTKPTEKPKIGTPGFGEFTAASLKKYEETGDETVLERLPKPAKEVDQGAVDTRRYRQEDSLRANFDNRVKPYVEEIDATSKILDVAAAVPPGKRPDPITQQAFVILLNKFLDPGSVVREGEFARVLEAQGVFRQAQMLKDRIVKGDILDQQSLDQITGLARTYQDIANRKIGRVANEIADVARRRNLDVESVILNPAYLTPMTPLGGERTPTNSGPSTRGRPRIPGSTPTTNTPPAVDVGSANAIVRGGR
jgi:hypothetical protein